MTLNCPSCAVLLTLADSAMNTLQTCPNCKSKFVASAALSAASSAAPAKKSGEPTPVDSEYAMDSSDIHANSNAAPEYLTWKKCPNCGKDWRQGSESCATCNYNGRLNRCVVLQKSRSGSIKLDFQKFYLWIFLAAGAFGVYWFLQNWASIRVWINSLWPKT